MKEYLNINNIYIKFKLVVPYMQYCFIILIRYRKPDTIGENEE